MESSSVNIITVSSPNLTRRSSCHQSSAKNEKSERSKLKLKIMKFFSFITVEPIMCFYAFPYVLASIAIYNLTFQMACRVNLNLNDTVCDNLLSNPLYEIQVQKEAAKLMVWKRPLSTLVPAVLIIFMGSYSDRYKIRKPFMLFPIIGEFLSTSCLILCTVYISKWPMEAAALSETIFSAFTGGFTTVKLAVYSYVADISSMETRTTRLGIVQVLSSIMSPLALFLSGIMYSTTGFYGVFSLRIVIFMCGVWYGLVFVKEPKRDPIPRVKHFLLDFFDPKNISDTFNILIQKKDGNRRVKIGLLMIAFIIVKGSTAGETDMLFLYVRLRFQWDDVIFGFYTTFDIIIRLIGSALALTIFSHWLRLDDLLVAPLTFMSKIIGSLIFAFCPSASFLYVASLLSLLGDYQTIPIRSLATKLVAEDELGKVQSLFGICEAFAPSIYVPLYSAVYRATVDYIPGAFYLISAGTLLPLIPAFLVMYLINCQTKTEERKEKTHIDKFRYIMPINDLL